MDAAVAALLIEGLWLMLIGLAIVFSFLLLLVGLLVLMSKAVARWGPDEPLPATLVVSHPVAQPRDEPRLIGVIAAAIHQYRHHNPP